MGTLATANMGVLLEKAIKEAITRDTEALFEEKKKQLIQEIDLRKSEVCAGVVLNVMKHVQMETRMDNLIITIRKDLKP